MGRYAGLVESRRLPTLIGAFFGLFLLLQYFELPYSRFLSSLLTPTKSEITLIYGFQNRNSSSVLVKEDSTCSNSTYGPFCSVPYRKFIDVADVPTSDPFLFKEKDSIERDNFSGNESLNFDIGLDDMMETDDEYLEIRQHSIFENLEENNVSSVENNRQDDQESRESVNDGRTTSSNNHSVGNMHASSKPGENSGNSSENRLQDHDISIAMIPKYNGSVPVSAPSLKKKRHQPFSISEMKDMLLESRTSYPYKKPRWYSSVDQELSHVKSLVMNAPIIKDDSGLDVSLYRNLSEFTRSYELMEQKLKVYIYREGERPAFHRPPLKGIYASEGWFMKLIKSNKRFVTKNPSKAHLFYLPFSSRNLVASSYIPDSHSHNNMIKRLASFTELIKGKYNFWNRTYGADHFLVACHDWAPVETREVMANCIRALCNADVKEGFRFGKDASLPETFVQSPQNPLRQLGGKHPSERRILAFFAGNLHGYVRPILLKHWQNKDADMKISGPISKGKGKGRMSYAEYMKSSKYCICAKGYEVNSPRVVEAIFFECVPVIISDNFVPPFFETLNWESFAVFVAEKDIGNLKKILLSITGEKYIEMQKRVKLVQQHFLWHSKPVKYDVFHMILHSLWYNRIFK